MQEDQNAMKGLRTLAVHAGEAPDPATGASAPNIAMATTYVQEELLAFSAHGAAERDSFIYTRWGNPTVQQLEKKLAALEGGEACLAFASGMAASAGLVLSLMQAGDHMICSDTNYAGTAELFRDTLPRFGMAVTPVDSGSIEAIEVAIRPETKLIWLETPANPILRLADIEATAALARRHGIALAVDSTFATPIATRPLALGADFVVHSLTKYIGGHGDALGGAVIGSREAIAGLRLEAGIHHGGVISPFNAWLIMRGMTTLPLRMKAHEEGASAVARFLEAHPKVKRVIYPGLESHPQHALAKRQMANFSGMLAFQVEGGAAEGAAIARRMMKELQVFHYAVSLGHQRSLIYWLDTEELLGSSYKLDGAAAESYRTFAGAGVFRTSIGIEDPEDLCADLKRCLD